LAGEQQNITQDQGGSIFDRKTRNIGTGEYWHKNCTRIQNACLDRGRHKRGKEDNRILDRIKAKYFT
jgi:hypothetical protein